MSFWLRTDFSITASARTEINMNSTPVLMSQKKFLLFNLALQHNSPGLYYFNHECSVTVDEVPLFQ